MSYKVNNGTHTLECSKCSKVYTWDCSDEYSEVKHYYSAADRLFRWQSGKKTYCSWCRECELKWSKFKNGQTSKPAAKKQTARAKNPAQATPRKKYIKVPRNPNKRGVAVDAAAIARACDELGVTRWPVHVKWSNGRAMRGAHRFKQGWSDSFGPRHSITITTVADAEEVSTCLWHELTHCAQLERVEGDNPALVSMQFTEQYRTENRRYGYRRNAFEVEARENMKKHWDRFKLAAQKLRDYGLGSDLLAQAHEDLAKREYGRAALNGNR